MCEDPPPREPPKLPRIRVFRRWSNEPYLMLPDEYTDPVFVDPLPHAPGDERHP